MTVSAKPLDERLCVLFLSPQLAFEVCQPFVHRLAILLEAMVQRILLRCDCGCSSCGPRDHRGEDGAEYAKRTDEESGTRTFVTHGAVLHSPRILSRLGALSFV